MSKIIKIVSLIALSPIIIFGLYLGAHGHLTPGGGFQSGVIIAAAFILIFIVFQNKIKLSHRLFSLFESLGLVFFIVLGFLGIFKNTFLYNFLANSAGFLGKTIQFGTNAGNLNSGGIIPLMNLAIGVEVASALVLITLLIIKHKNGKKYD
jgi:multisubunit Na+/H+ antiporter MnhB subunit